MSLKDRDLLEIELASMIAETLEMEISNRGEAILAVSGGSTPKGLFEKLSKIEIQWKNVTILPVDDRILSADHEDQNGTMIRSLLVQNKAAVAKFIPLVYNANDKVENLLTARENIGQLKLPITVALLGMGLDGHTASLFPCSNELKAGLDLDNPESLINVQPQNAPYDRISLTASTILDSKKIFLQIFGVDKKDLLEKARIDGNPMKYPINSFLGHEQLKIYWSN